MAIACTGSVNERTTDAGGLTAAALAEMIGAVVVGDGEARLTGCAGLEAAGPQDVTFLANRKYAKMLGKTRAGAVILGEADTRYADGQTLLVAKDPYFAFRETVVALHGFREHPSPGISESAVIDPSATIGLGCSIHPFACIAEGATIGDGCVIYPHCYVGRDAVIGEGSVLFANVTVYDRCVVGRRVTLHSGCVIGQDGFGYATHRGAHHKIPQIGNAVIEDDVEMGAGCVVDRATVGSTRVGEGSKFSDLVAIGHGAQIGRHNLIVAQVGIAGSTQTGNYVAMGGQAGVAGHLKIGDQARIAAKAGVMDDLDEKGEYGGQPALPMSQTKRNILALTRLPQMMVQFRKLQKRVAQLEAQLGQPVEPVQND